jgi:FAD/FMN-containing dehydrogenase
MGLYAIATELTIKVQPFPETRIAAVARYRLGSQSMRKVLARLSQVKHIKSLEFIAPHGLQGEITISPGIEGLEALAGKSVRDCEAAMESPDLIEYREDSPDIFFRHVRREISKELVGPGFYTVSVPPSASVALIERLSALMPDAPVIAHPLMGRFHVVCSDAASVSALEKVSLALGGKRPAEWRTSVVRGISGLFTDGELAIARSLKRELDPGGILNPHLRLL